MELVKYIKENNKKHIIFDFDATIFLLLLPWSRWHEGIQEKLRDIDADIWDAFNRGDINNNALQVKYIQNHGDTVRDFLNEHTAAFEVEALEDYHTNTDILLAIDELKKSQKTLYIWSSNARPVIDQILNETGLTDVFQKIVTRQDVSNIKPNPDGFYVIFDENKHVLSDFLMVGDSSHDRGAAQAAGIDFYLTDFFNLGR